MVSFEQQPMKKQSLILIRDFLFKTFIVGILFAIFFFLVTAFFWDFWSSTIYSVFHVNEQEAGKLIASWFLHLRFFLIFIILVPAISLHWVIKSIKD